MANIYDNTFTLGNTSATENSPVLRGEGVDPTILSNPGITANNPISGDGTVQDPLTLKTTELEVIAPLYTAQSGTTFYIGSNQNQTLLFSSFPPTATGTLSESRKNFERLKIEVGYGSQTGTYPDGYSYWDVSNRADYSYMQFGFGAGGSNQYYAAARIHFTSDTAFSVEYGSSIIHTVNSTTVAGNTSYNNGVKNCVCCIYGINRISG